MRASVEVAGEVFELGQRLQISSLLGKHVTKTNALESLVIPGWVRGLCDRDITAAAGRGAGAGPDGLEVERQADL